MIGGVIAVMGLVLWALTRTVEGPSATPLTPPVAVSTTTAPLTTSPNAEETQKAAVPRITADDLRPRVQRGEVTVIDVRDASAYAIAHIPGALNIPLARIESEVAYLPKAKPIVTYCT